MVLNVTDGAQRKRSACLEDKEQVISEQSRHCTRTVTLWQVSVNHCYDEQTTILSICIVADP
jgi:hypothetical protein